MLEKKSGRETNLRTLHITFVLAIAALVLFAPCQLHVHAVAGDLDASFGSGGRVTTDLGGFDIVYAMTIQNDGKIITAGTAGLQFALARYNADGSLDTEFGEAGKVKTDFYPLGAQFEVAYAVALQPDGKIVAAGYGGDSSRGLDFALARYNSDGTLDKSFGDRGKVVTEFRSFNSTEFIQAIGIQSDGRIVAVGGASSPGFGLNQVFGVARYNTDGSIDPTFGTGGKTSVTFFNNSSINEMPRAVAFQPDGKIVVAGFASSYFGIARFNSDGSLDTGFGNGGKVITDFENGGDEAIAISLQSDGHMLVAGRSTHSVADEDLAVARYNPDGTLDTNFGVGGMLRADFFPTGTGISREGLNSIIFQDDQKIIAAGFTQFNSDFGVVRYNLDGTLDSGFGLNGKVVTDFGTSREAPYALAVQQDGKIVAAGATGSGDFAIARYDEAALPDFSLGFNATQVNAERGEKIRVPVNINRIGGFSGSVTVIPPDASAIRIKVQPAEPVSSIERNVSFKLKIKGGAPPGAHQLTFTGRDTTGRTRTATMTVLVQ